MIDTGWRSVRQTLVSGLYSCDQHTGMVMAKPAAQKHEQIWPVFTAAGTATTVQDVAVLDRRCAPAAAVGTIIF